MSKMTPTSGIEFLVWLLIAASINAMLANRLRIPYTVSLVVGGLPLAVIHIPILPPLQPGHRPDWLTPDVILILFLPALVFEGSVKLDLQELLRIRGRLSATGCKESWSTHRGWPTVRTSQLASRLKQLAGEQSESRTENRSGNPALQQGSDHARSVHAGRQRRNTGGTGRIPERCGDEHHGGLKAVGWIVG